MFHFLFAGTARHIKDEFWNLVVHQQILNWQLKIKKVIWGRMAANLLSIAETSQEIEIDEEKLRFFWSKRRFFLTSGTTLVNQGPSMFL